MDSALDQSSGTDYIADSQNRPLHKIIRSKSVDMFCESTILLENRFRRSLELNKTQVLLFSNFNSATMNFWMW